MKRDSGSTLLEVLVASIILVASAAVFVTGVTTHSNSRKKVDVKANTALELSAAAQYIQSLPYEYCNSSTTTLPYVNALAAAKGTFVKMSATNLAITAVEGRYGSTWLNCQDWGSNANIVDGVLQDLNSLTPLITRVAIKDLISERVMYVSKIHSGFDPQSTFKVNALSTSYSCGGWWGGSLSATVNATRNGTAVSGLTYFIMPPGPSRPLGISSDFGTAASGTTFTVTAPTGSFGGKRTNLEVGAFDPATSTYALPVSIPMSFWNNVGVTASVSNPVVVNTQPINITLTGSGGGDPGSYIFSASSPFTITPTTASATATLSWSTSPSAPALGTSSAARTYTAAISSKWECWPAQSVTNYSLTMRQSLKGALLSGATGSPLNTSTGTLYSTGSCTSAQFTSGCTVYVSRLADVGSSREATGTNSWFISKIIVGSIVSGSARTWETITTNTASTSMTISSTDPSGTATNLVDQRTSDYAALRLAKITSGGASGKVCRDSATPAGTILQVAIELKDANFGSTYTGTTVASALGTTPTSGAYPISPTSTAYVLVYITC